MNNSSDKPLVSIIIGSASDWETMVHCARQLEKFGIPYEKNISSAHRTPAKTAKIVSTAKDRGIKIIIAAAGGAAHLAGVCASETTLPVFGVPMKGWALDGLDSLLSTVMMPRGMPVCTFAIGKAGAVNAAVAALQVLALENADFEKTLKDYRAKQTSDVENAQFPEIK